MKQLSTLLLVICLSFRIFGQQETMPKACTNPGDGILVGGGFSIYPQFACLDFSSNSATIFAANAVSPSGGQLSNVGYIFNFKDGDSLNFKAPTSTTVSKPGTYWIMQGGNEKGQDYITCQSVEVIQTEQPDVKVSSCGDKSVTITFLNTPKNKKHGKYRILWGDGSQDFTNQSQLSFPFDKTHLYTNPPTSQPIIVAIYTRGTNKNIDVCQSTPYSFNSVMNNKPVINELEGLNGGESAKLTVAAGLDGQEYTIQKKTDKGNWTDTGKKIIRNSGISSATQTIEGLNKDSLYCFRLQQKDKCNNEVLSNETCMIKLNATLLSANEAKLDWNVPSANLNRYLISYSDYPTGENPNTIPATSTSQMLDFLDCKKKYNFQITAFNGSSPAFSQIRIKSHQILIDPSSIKEYPAPDNISTVSVEDSNKIRYSIFETLGYLKNKYIFYRSVDGNTFEKVGESYSNFYIDKDVNLDKNQYCYAFKYEDECGIQSALSTNKACNIKLSLENATLTWTPLSTNSSTYKPTYFVEIFEGNQIIETYQTSQLIWNVKKDFDLAILRNSNTGITLHIKGVINYNLLINGAMVPFPLEVYSNTVTYNPILSTSKEADRLNIYPNPSEDFVQLNSTLQLKTVEIVDLQGKIIENQSIENGQVSVKHLPKGKYILRLYGNDKKLISSKIIIKM